MVVSVRVIILSLIDVVSAGGLTWLDRLQRGYRGERYR
jgi:hypothetical protein